MHNHGGQNEFDAKAATSGAKEQAQTVNIESLTIARELLGLTQTELARGAGFSQAKISRFEDGISQPSQEEIGLLAEALGQHPRFFYRSDVKRSVFNSFYRKRKSVPQKALMQFNARVCVRQVQIDRLLNKAEVDATPIPRFDPEDYRGGLKQVAASLRQLLKLSPGPVRNFIRALEDIGVVVVLEDFGITKIDGVSTYTNKGQPIIFLNLQAPPSRRRFSAAHEFAHSALHKYLAPDVDEQADALAAELLMPEDEIYPDLTSQLLTVLRLADLKLKWRTSMASILFRAKTLKAIEPRRYSYLWMKMSADGYRIREPHEGLMEDEKPNLEREIIQFHRDELNYSVAEIAESLDVTEREVLGRYNLPAELRIV
jgi:Zn-dependent peptidase ImmA (M78 family)/DNA-binding transcriptional regulator YiaG